MKQTESQSDKGPFEVKIVTFVEQNCNGPEASSEAPPAKGNEAPSKRWWHGRSLFLFAEDNPVRMGIAQMLEHRYFDDFIYNLIGLNSIILMIDYPIITDDYTNNTYDSIGTVISIVFVVEAALKIVAKGFVLGPDCYLKDNWNILDFLIVLSAILTWILTTYSSINLAFMRGFRALRALRPLRIISKDEGMKTVINSLLRAIPNLFNVSIIYLFTILVFAILGVQLFSGEMSACSDDSVTLKSKCVGTDADGNPREWQTPFNNFNDVIFGMITLFELTTFENWNNTIVLLT